MDMKKLSIVIITLNEENNLPLLLQDLERQTAQDYEAIVVDSASTDRTVERAQAFDSRLPELRIVRMKRRGVSLGRNTGASMARCERMLFLDADSRLDEDFLERALAELEETGASVAGAYMKTRNCPLPVRLGISLFNFGMRLTRPWSPTAVGACIFSTRTLHRAIGGFDETIVLCEDCDYVRRATKKAGRPFFMLTPRFYFNTRRLEQDGILKTGWIYLRANTRRMFFGEIHGNPYHYQFGHYVAQEQETLGR